MHFTPLSDSVTILKIKTLVKELWHKTYLVKKWCETEKWSRYSILGHCSRTKVFIFKMVTESERGVKMQNPAFRLFCNLIFLEILDFFWKIRQNSSKMLIFKRIRKFHKKSNFKNFGQPDNAFLLLFSNL